MASINSLTIRADRTIMRSMRRFAQILTLFMVAVSSAHAQIDLDDPEVREKIIAQAVEVTPKYQADGTWVFYERHTRLPYKGTGWAVSYYDDGIRLEGLRQFKEGKREGLHTTWYKKGQMKVEVNFIDGKKYGLLNHSYMEMQKWSEENYKDGREDGLFTIWYYN